MLYKLCVGQTRQQRQESIYIFLQFVSIQGDSGLSCSGNIMFQRTQNKTNSLTSQTENITRFKCVIVQYCKVYRNLRYKLWAHQKSAMISRILPERHATEEILWNFLSLNKFKWHRIYISVIKHTGMTLSKFREPSPAGDGKGTYDSSGGTVGGIGQSRTSDSYTSRYRFTFNETRATQDKQ